MRRDVSFHALVIPMPKRILDDEEMYDKYLEHVEVIFKKPIKACKLLAGEEIEITFVEPVTIEPHSR